MNLLAYFRTVLWGFLDIRRRSAATEDVATVSPFGLIGVAAVVLGFTLLGLANLAVNTLK
jgi:hypothetical protein